MREAGFLPPDSILRAKIQQQLLIFYLETYRSHQGVLTADAVNEKKQKRFGIKEELRSIAGVSVYFL